MRSVHDSLVCSQCGYPLRGLPRTGACPECGRSIAATAHADSIARLERRFGAALSPQFSRRLVFPLLIAAVGLAAAHLVSYHAPALGRRADAFRHFPWPTSLWPLLAGSAGALAAARLGRISCLSHLELVVRALSVLAASVGAGAVGSLVLPGYIAAGLAFYSGLRWLLPVPPEDQPFVGAHMLVAAMACWFITAAP